LGQAVEGRLQHTDGTQRMVEQSTFPISTGRGLKIGMIVRDVTARKQAEAALRESEALYHLVIDNLGEGAGLADPHEHFISANPATEQLFGVAPGGLTGRSLLDFLTPETDSHRHSQNHSMTAPLKRPAFPKGLAALVA
jgi:two-component system cell cycle sensor histidine kinase/response regulator CckA